MTRILYADPARIVGHVAGDCVASLKAAAKKDNEPVFISETSGNEPFQKFDILNSDFFTSCRARWQDGLPWE